MGCCRGGPPGSVSAGRCPTHGAGRQRVTRIEAVIDLGFTRSPAGFQAEGLVVERARRRLDSPAAGHSPAAHELRTRRQTPRSSTCSSRLRRIRRSRSSRRRSQGLPDTASTDPIYRFRTADLVLVDVETEALVHDLDVLDGVMRSLALGDPRRAKLRRAIARSARCVPDVAAARHVLAPHLVTDRRRSPTSPDRGHGSRAHRHSVALADPRDDPQVHTHLRVGRRADGRRSGVSLQLFTGAAVRVDRGTAPRSVRADHRARSTPVSGPRSAGCGSRPT